MNIQTKIIAAIVLACTLFLGYEWIGARAVAQYKAEQIALKAEADNILQKKYDKLEDKYLATVASRKEKAEVTERIIEKIVDRPVYLTVCADSEGVEAANKALRGE